MKTWSMKNAKEADIALLLEGSYPFVLGGVSEWVQQIITNFPQYNFALIFMGGAPENYKDGIRYVKPDNVTHFQIHYLFEAHKPSPKRDELIGNAQWFEKIKTMHDLFNCPGQGFLDEISDISVFIDEKTGVDFDQFSYSKLSWDLICEKYNKQCPDSSFIDYYWTIKNIHAPLWKIAKIVKTMPKVKLVHAVSTGYAGLLSFLVQRHWNYPVILTEHGIYTRERKIDIFLSRIFQDDVERPLTEASYLRNLWDRFFRTLSHLSYSVANPIVSLFQEAHHVQIEEGANPNKAIIIPNGINIERYKKLRRTYKEKQAVVAFVGRMVPMKDIKGLIRAIPHVHKQMPELKFWIIGSTDQDPKYAQECRELVENILLQDIIEFKPHLPMEEILPKIRVLVLPAIRESMPLVVLESCAAGVPVVATDVGACRELLLGLDEQDKALGPGGCVVKVADPPGLAEGILNILQDPKLWTEMSASAIKRAEKYYNEQTMFDKYRQLYEGTITSWQESDSHYVKS